MNKAPVFIDTFDRPAVDHSKGWALEPEGWTFESGVTNHPDSQVGVSAVRFESDHVIIVLARPEHPAADGYRVSFDLRFPD